MLLVSRCLKTISHDIRVVCKYDMPVDIFQWMSLNITLVLKCKMHGKATPKLYSMNFVGNQFCVCPNFLHNPHKYTINLIRCCIIYDLVSVSLISYIHCFIKLVENIKRKKALMWTVERYLLEAGGGETEIKKTLSSLFATNTCPYCILYNQSEYIMPKTEKLFM